MAFKVRNSVVLTYQTQNSEYGVETDLFHPKQVVEDRNLICDIFDTCNFNTHSANGCFGVSGSTNIYELNCTQYGVSLRADRGKFKDPDGAGYLCDVNTVFSNCTNIPLSWGFSISILCRSGDPTDSCLRINF